MFTRVYGVPPARWSARVATARWPDGIQSGPRTTLLPAHGSRCVARRRGVRFQRGLYRTTGVGRKIAAPQLLSRLSFLLMGIAWARNQQLSAALATCGRKRLLDRVAPEAGFQQTDGLSPARLPAVARLGSAPVQETGA